MGGAPPRATRYRLASRVLPGAALVRASRRRTSALIKVDLPTFDRPTSAISGVPSLGRSAALAALVTNSALIFTGWLGLVGRMRLVGAVADPPVPPAYLPDPPFSE